MEGWDWPPYQLGLIHSDQTWRAHTGQAGLVSFSYTVVTVSLLPDTLCELSMRAGTPAEEAGLDLEVEGDPGLVTTPSPLLFTAPSYKDGATGV